MRVGHGYDAHRLETGRPLILGGVEIHSEKGLVGHSDADVLVHAIMDALLGAAAMGDIGDYFPDTDAKWHGASSVGMMKEVAGMLVKAGWVVNNIDSTIVAQAPKLAPYISEMRETLAQALNIDTDRVSVKATTTEGMGFAGQGAGMEAYAVATITGSR